MDIFIKLRLTYETGHLGFCITQLAYSDNTSVNLTKMISEEKLKFKPTAIGDQMKMFSEKTQLAVEPSTGKGAHASVISSTSRIFGGTIAVSRSNVYAAWWNNKTGDFEVMFRASADSGHTFGPKINLSNSPGNASTDAQIGAEGKNVYVIWWETSGHTAEPFLRISYDNGNTFGQKIRLSNATAVALTTS